MNESNVHQAVSSTIASFIKEAQEDSAKAEARLEASRREDRDRQERYKASTKGILDAWKQA